MANQYAERDIMGLDKKGGHYSRHLSAMTGEGLHDKSDIAAELAYRDARISQLEADCAAHKAAEETQIALREKADEREAALGAQAQEFRKKSQELHIRYPLSPWIQKHYESVMKSKPEQVLDCRDALKQMEALDALLHELASDLPEKCERKQVFKAFKLRIETLSERANKC